MKSHAHDPLRSRLKHLIADLYRLELADPDDIADDEVLIGGSLGLDSLDALELALCLEQEFGIVLDSREEARRAFASISCLADFIQARPPPHAGQTADPAVA